MSLIQKLTLCSLVVLSVVKISDGLPIDGRDENVPRRVSRSLHALHQRLCPVGTSSERCFRKHLSIFASIANPIDPVKLRNIGKRSEPMKKPSKSMLTFTDDDVNALVDQFEPEILNNLLQALLQEEDDSIYYDEMYNTLNKLRGYDDNKEFVLNTNHDTPVDENSFGNDWDEPIKKQDTERQNLQKRQLICRSGISAEECFNNALKYYLSLYNAMKRTS
ncbi:hypothetical protein DPMN_187281 [Dreissena polymorpha]|uniref:Uncharacterized protein n=1 Tax=Dreissena polymorpha TaxID=45954 RepID=A0A9D4DQQ1_DREPO|nr:hypothetical protein DPMN_187281 [Dreissena polymorpha]